MTPEEINPIPEGFHRKDAIFLAFLFIVAVVGIVWVRSN